MIRKGFLILDLVGLVKFSQSPWAFDEITAILDRNQEIIGQLLGNDFSISYQCGLVIGSSDPDDQASRLEVLLTELPKVLSVQSMLIHAIRNCADELAEALQPLQKGAKVEPLLTSISTVNVPEVVSDRQTLSDLGLEAFTAGRKITLTSDTNSVETTIISSSIVNHGDVKIRECHQFCAVVKPVYLDGNTISFVFAYPPSKPGEDWNWQGFTGGPASINDSSGIVKIAEVKSA